MGSSFGGLTALRIACRHPERVWAVVASGSPGLGHHTYPGFRALFRPTLDDALAIRDFLFVNVTCFSVELVQQVLKDVAERKLLYQQIQLFRALDRYDAWADLERLDLDVFLIWGETDRLVPPGRWVDLSRHNRKVSLHYIPGTGHVPMRENPQEFNAALRTLLRLP